MSAAITLSKLSWATPDGRSLLSNLDLSFGPERTGLVGRNGVGKTTLLRLIAGELAPRAGSIAVTGRIAALRQNVSADPTETIAGLFGVQDALALLARAERGAATAQELADADWTLEARIAAALERVGLAAGPETALGALSGGQAVRAALAALVFAEADFLLLDEPTNNLDREGRRAVIDLLAGWRGGALVVSHDRELLETMDAIVELSSLGATRYGGNWSQYRARKALELAAAQHDLADAERDAEEAARRAQAAVERQARRDGAGRRKSAAGGMPRIVAGGLKRRAEATSGANARLAARQGEEAAAAVAAARARVEILQPLSMTLPPTGLPAGRTVLRIEHVTAGYERRRPILRDFSLLVSGPERIAVMGPNGAGKTTLLSLVAGRIAPWQGEVAVPAGHAMLDQQVSLLDPALSIAVNFRRLNPGANDQSCRAALARFMFRADAALQVAGTLSGGQLLRAGLSCVFGGAAPPALLILDEPTNHLDLDSLEAVEAALRAYDGALLVVSHDEAFLEAIGVTRRVAL